MNPNVGIDQGVCGVFGEWLRLYGHTLSIDQFDLERI
jgi:hypothetical protein